MRLLRKTGVRSPFLPGPILSPDLNPLRATIVIGAIVPALLLGGNTQPIGRLPRAEDPTGPSRPAALVQQPIPIPGANVAQTYAPRDTAIVQVDHTWPVPIVSGQQPLPGALAWAPFPARVPNTDPLRPPILAQVAPDPTLAQSATLTIGRLTRPEDVNWPARPPSVQGPAVPIPGAVLWAGTPARLPDDAPLRPPLLIADPPDATLAQGSATPIGRLARSEDVQWPARPASVVMGAVPVPGAVCVLSYAPRDVVALPDRLALMQLIVTSPPIPSAQAVPVGRVAAPPLERLPLGVRVDGPLSPQIGAMALVVGRAAPAPTERLAGIQAISPVAPLPSAIALQSYAPRDQVVTPADRAWPLILIAGGMPQPGAVALVVGTVHAAPTERLAQTVAQSPAFVPPAAITLPIGIVRDGDRLALTQVLQTPPPPVPALLVPVGAPRAASLIRLPIATLPVIRPAEPLPIAIALPVGLVHETPLLRLAPAWVVNPPFVPPDATLALVPIAFHPRAGALIVGRIAVAWASTAPGAAFTATLPEVAFVGTAPAIMFEED
jgi:hypothetical protein